MSQVDVTDTVVTIVGQLGDPVDVKVKDITDPVVKAEIIKLLNSSKMRIGKLVKRL